MPKNCDGVTAILLDWAIGTASTVRAGALISNAWPTLGLSKKEAKGFALAVSVVLVAS
jgi:hypothetical protein